ncbi:meckelin-like, partial [Lingula anatina]|uniref:Meckelin-like n=1 Tax=Lingula anatina TaxID=7574 RepID=A0A1S3I499_LINAN
SRQLMAGSVCLVTPTTDLSPQILAPLVHLFRTLQVTAKNGWECVGCRQYSTTNTVTCAGCTATEIAVERLLDGQWIHGTPQRTCQTCAAGTVPSADGTRCVRCNQVISMLNVQNSCDCQAGQQSGGLCFPSDPNLPTGTDFTIRVEESDVTSAFFRDNLGASYEMCKFDSTTGKYGNLTACQTLGNMCMLTYYKDISTVGSSGSAINRKACELYDLVKGSSSQDWPPNMPWLYYSENGKNVLDDTGITQDYYVSPSHANSKLKLIVAKYALNGTFLGLENVTGDTLQICSGNLKMLNAALQFGTTYSLSCQVSMDDLWDENKYPLIFYDLYLEFTDSSGARKLYAVPVLIENIDSTKHTATNQEEWKMTRRFFLIDNQALKTPPSE